MNDKKDSVKRNWTVVLYLSILFIVILIGQDLLREVVFFSRDLNEFEDNLQTELQQSLEDDIEAKKALINYRLATLEEQFSQEIRDNLKELHFIIEETMQFHDLSTIENQEQVIDIMTRYQEQNQDHEYVLLTYDGYRLFSGLSTIESQDNQLDQQDVFGRYYIREMITLLANNDEGFVNYYLKEDNQINRYKAYVSRISGQPFFLMTYGEEAKFKDQIIKQTIESIKLYGLESSGDIFIYEQNGLILHHESPQFISTDLQKIHDPYLYKVKRLIDFIVTSKQSGFISYDFYENGISSDIVKKTAYVTYVEELDLVIGSSIDSDYYSQHLANFKEMSYQRIFLFKIPMYFVLVTLAMVIYQFVRNNIKRSLFLLKEEELLYQRFADLTDEIIMITNLKGEIIFLNKLGERILKPGDRNHTLTLDEILKEEEQYYIMHTSEQTYYVKFNVDDIFYHGEPSKLYLFHDVTEAIESIKEIQSVSTRDDLTNLGNRRLLNQDFKEKIEPRIRNGEQAYLAIIDLDLFKSINDTYGHVYGDEVLQVISMIMKNHTNDHTRIYRIGGDEFALIAYHTTKDAIISTLSEMKAMMEHHVFDKPIKVSFSAGIQTLELSPNYQGLASFYHAADKKLYRAKNEGRNKIII